MKHVHTFESFLNEATLNEATASDKANAVAAKFLDDLERELKVDTIDYQMGKLTPKGFYVRVVLKDANPAVVNWIADYEEKHKNDLGPLIPMTFSGFSEISGHKQFWPADGKKFFDIIRESLNEGLDPKKVEKLLDDLYAQSQKVKDSNYNMVEIKKLDAIEREAVKMGVAKAIGSAWYKDKTPKEVHKKYKEYGFAWMSESVNEAMTFDEVKDEYIENPYGIGAQRIEFIDKSGGNPRMLVFRHDNRYDRDKIETKLRSMGFPAKKLKKSVGDKAFMYPYELYLSE